MAIIPVNNPPALLGYYFGVASLMPLLGMLAAPVAIICGILGVRKARIQPEAAGMGHAITAILLGLGGPLFWLVLFFYAISP